MFTLRRLLLTPLTLAAALLALCPTPNARAQQTATATVPNYMPKYQYMHLQYLLAHSPELQERAKQAQATGVNDKECYTAHQGHTYQYPINTGTDPSGYYYNPLCPRGSVAYLWYPPSEGPKYWVPGSTATWQAPAPQCHYEIGLVDIHGGQHYVRRRVCSFACPVNIMYAGEHGGVLTRNVEYTDPRAAQQNPEAVARCKAMVAARAAAAQQQAAQRQSGSSPTAPVSALGAATAAPGK